MKLCLLVFGALVSVMAIERLNAEPNGKAETSPAHSSVTSVIRTHGNLGCLILQRDQRDLVEICSAAPGGLVPRLQDAYMLGNQLAAVLDYDQCFCYQRYEQDGEVWKLKQETYFSAMTSMRNQRLMLVEMPDLTHAKLLFSKVGDNPFREKGKTQTGDREEIFEFLGNGTMLKNGNPYSYSSGLETN